MMASGQVELVLDIGTYKVLALATNRTDEGVEVLASSFVPHRARSMRDGQVHDVPAVARTVRQAVNHVSNVLGVEFSGAHIAAAGRALKTARGGAERSEPRAVLITPDMARSMEWEAVADAQLRLLESLPSQDQRKGFYCIAHTVAESRLDGQVIAALTGQRGSVFSVEVLATFLPGVVVDSLEAVLVEAGLEMHGLTLEPVAALEAVIPPTMRHLNLALVDIGAGTSDIALTGNGMVQAFAMVPRGGDAITEAASKAFLLDFHVAEDVKRSAASGAPATADNVLGDTVTITAEELMEAVRPTTNLLADDIAAALSEWTRNRPLDAMLLVGGGSHTPGLPRALAQRIGLDEGRVAVRDRKAVRNAVGEDHLSGADAVTALGIALRAARGKEMPPVRVRLNERAISLFQPDRCTVREAARIAGLPLAQLVGRPGPGMTITLNGVITTLPGTRGEPAAVLVNGAEATLDTRLHNQDEVTLKLPTAGTPPRFTMADMARRWLEQADGPPPEIEFNGVATPVPLRLERNARPAHPSDVINDRDVITVRFVETAAELVAALNAREAGASATVAAAAADAVRWPSGTCTVNGRPVDLGDFATLFRNGVPAGWTDPVEHGDVWEYRHQQPITVRCVIEYLGLASHRTMTVVLNGEPTTISLPTEIQRNGTSAAVDDLITDGDRIQVATTGPVALYQILPHAGVSMDGAAANGRLVLLVGGQQAGFTTPVSDGDEVIIRYER